MSRSNPETSATRRDLLTLTAGAFVAVGGAAAVWPLLSQMAPNPATPAPETSSVDLTRIAPGQTALVRWRGLPVFVRHRTPVEIEAARTVSIAELPDPLARNANLPAAARASDDNRTAEGHRDWLVVVGLCTHLNCLLKDSASMGRNEASESWFCPCHAARFDSSGRVRGGPARTNLPVPPLRFEGRTTLVIG